MKSLVVLISGSGSNLQAIIEACQDGRISGHISAVISNKADAYGLVRAQQAGIHTQVVPSQGIERALYDNQLQQVIDSYQPDVVVLAGFMRILTAGFVQHYSGRLLNIHPSLLPKYQGLNTHQRAIDAGDAEHGCSVHFVTEELDGGPVIAQARVPVLANDDAPTLAQRVLQQEHQLYPTAIEQVLSGQVSFNNN